MGELAKIMNKVPFVLESIMKQYQSALRAIVELETRQKALKNAGLEYGSPSYKNGRYLRVVKPASGDSGRQFLYIGADPEKQKAVLEAIDRGKVYNKLGRKITALSAALVDLEYDLKCVESEFCWSHEEILERSIE